MRLYEFLAASGNTKCFGDRFEVWVHHPYDEDMLYSIDIDDMGDFVKYAGCEVFYFHSDYKDSHSWTVVGVKAPHGNQYYF